MRKTIIAGNWKMNKTSFEAIELVTLLKRELSDINEIDIVVCPPATGLSEVQDVLTESNILLGAQNLFWEDSGAYTGEISGDMLKHLGVQFVIVGHSERRQYFGETDETVNKRIKAALKWELTPIVCMGENLKERQQNQTFKVVEKQCLKGLEGFTKKELEKMIIAYEPIWAIGTGVNATSTQAQEVQKFIRQLLAKLANEDVASRIRIQYGGSVKPENISELVAQPDIDGALVGGASLNADSFIKIVKNSCGVKTSTS